MNMRGRREKEGIEGKAKYRLYNGSGEEKGEEAIR